MRAVAGGGQAPPRRGGQLVVVGHPELGAVAAGLLEVVAEDLVQLDELGPVLLQPGCEALVEVGAGRLRQRVVGGVADQQVAEAEAVLAGELRPVRPDQLLADERGQARRHLGLVGCERLDGAAVEDLALDRAALEHAPLGRLELIEARREQRLQRGRDDHLAVRLAGHRQHLLDEERVAARGASDPLAQLAGDPLRDQLVDVLVAQRLEPKRHRPGGAALGELRPRHAEQQDRCARGQERDVLDQVEERLLAPLDVVEDDHERPLRRGLLQRLAERPGDLLRRRRRLRLAEQRADRRRGGLVRGQHVELLQHLDDRPVGDPLAVGEAAAADDRRVDRSQSLRGEPGLADAGIADDRDQLAALLGPHALPCLPEERELALTADEQLPVPALRRVVHAQQPVGGNRLGLALQLERLDRLDLGRVANERERRLPRSAPRPAAPPAPAARRR